MSWYHKCYPRTPTPLEVATKELVEAEHAKLLAETAREYAQAAVDFNKARITRLEEYILDTRGRMQRG